mmetsp:Transcript_23846/g.44053  ORF Transcript_23846/g.44053 Transcript_23846/m.44053 type:complete len:156 (-) Transcript_23846:372-839(-)
MKFHSLLWFRCAVLLSGVLTASGFVDLKTLCDLNHRKTSHSRLPLFAHSGLNGVDGDSSETEDDEFRSRHIYHEEGLSIKQPAVVDGATALFAISAVFPYPTLAAEISQKTEGMSPAFESAGKWFFVAYVVFSLLAGAKEFVVRFQKWRDDSSDD